MCLVGTQAHRQVLPPIGQLLYKLISSNQIVALLFALKHDNSLMDLQDVFCVSLL